MAQKSQPKPAPENGVSGRAPDGKFSKGNVGGPGRPKRLEIQFWSDVRSVVSRRRWRKAVEAVLTAAEGGDLDAFKLLRDLVLGKPESRPSFVDLELARLDGRDFATEKVESQRSSNAQFEFIQNLGMAQYEQEAKELKILNHFGGAKK